MIELPTIEGGFGCVLADPPWRFETYSAKGEGRSASRHYSTMTLDEIKALPVREIVAKDAALFLWADETRLLDAMAVIDAWGFQPNSIGFVWTKMRKDGAAPRMGLGYSTRKCCEICLLAKRGSPKRLDRGVPQALLAPRREHSRKPDEFYGRIERLYRGPYIELFARQRWSENWTAWGNQVGKFTPPARDGSASVQEPQHRNVHQAQGQGEASLEEPPPGPGHG